jgi:hypothetical protein
MSNAWPWIIGGAVVAGGAYLFMRRSQAAAPAPAPILTTSTSDSASYQLVGYQLDSVNPSTTADLLRSSESARQIYAFQLLAYVFGLTQAVPSGVLTDDTTQAVARVYSDVGQTSVGFTAGAINIMGQAILHENGGQVPEPTNTAPTLPSDVVPLISAEIPASVKTQLQIG